ncbi:MAG: ComF family protein [Lachnospirales bacterium]
MSYIKRFTDYIKNICIPRNCVKCGRLIPYNKKSKWYCDKCSPFEYVTKYNIVCEKCGKPINSIGKCQLCNDNMTCFDRGYVVYLYEGNVRDNIIKFKFKNLYSLAEFFAEDMYKYALDNIEEKYDIITCVPLHRKAQRIRGYNQSELIAKKLAKFMGYKYNRTLKKVINTKKQSSLNAKERTKNIKNAFKCCYDVKGKNILLIDDVMTTGSTLNECSRILKNAGASRVDVFSVASPLM